MGVKHVCFAEYRESSIVTEKHVLKLNGKKLGLFISIINKTTFCNCRDNSTHVQKFGINVFVGPVIPNINSK